LTNEIGKYIKRVKVLEAISIKMEEKVLVGRRANIGSMYFEKTNYGNEIRKFCVGYCSKCGQKQGLTSAEMQELSDNLPTPHYDLIARLLHTKVIIPR